MWEVLRALEKKISEDITIEKAGTFRGGQTTAVAKVTGFDGKKGWIALNDEDTVNMDITIKRLSRLHNELKRIAPTLLEQ